MRLDIHVHSNYSDGIPTPEEIVEYCKSIGLNGVAITDHDCIEGSLQACKLASKDFTVIPGVEISAKEGHILALGIRELIEEDLSAEETVRRIHELGGIAIAAHPYDRYRRGVGDLILKIPFDAVEVLNGHTFTNTKNPEKIALQAKLPKVGGTDAHALGEIGNVSIVVEGNPLEAIKKGQVEIKSIGKGRLACSHAKTLFGRVAAGIRKRI
ncbi:MAG: PHP domain-containing protein [Candidatus Altiarchaeales archaeon]|nr:PHP domain-containing protein [Candidatus Altiarchaeales archaeon]